MPSLHAADAVVIGVTLASVVRARPLWLVFLAWPAWVCFCLLASGNHFVLDVVAGIALAGAALVAPALSPRLPFRRTLIRVDPDDSAGTGLHHESREEVKLS